MQEKRLFLLDAYALIYRSYYAFIKNPRINSKGINTSAILGVRQHARRIVEKKKTPRILPSDSIRKAPHFATRLMNNTRLNGKKLPK